MPAPPFRLLMTLTDLAQLRLLGAVLGNLFDRRRTAEGEPAARRWTAGELQALANVPAARFPAAARALEALHVLGCVREYEPAQKGRQASPAQYGPGPAVLGEVGRGLDVPDRFFTHTLKEGRRDWIRVTAALHWDILPDNGERGRVTVRRVADLTGLRVGTVHAALQGAGREGYLGIEKPGKGGRATVYRIPRKRREGSTEREHGGSTKREQEGGTEREQGGSTKREQLSGSTALPEKHFAKTPQQHRETAVVPVVVDPHKQDDPEPTDPLVERLVAQGVRLPGALAAVRWDPFEVTKQLDRWPARPVATYRDPAAALVTAIYERWEAEAPRQQTPAPERPRCRTVDLAALAARNEARIQQDEQAGEAAAQVRAAIARSLGLGSRLERRPAE